MSVLIEGMEMPENCMTCGFYRAGIGCVATRTMFAPTTNVATRQSNCPLIEIPTPHGDLIVRDALITAICKRLGIRDEEYLTAAESVIVNEIYNAETIIPAKETT